MAASVPASTDLAAVSLAELADVNPESLASGTPGDTRFRYVDLGAADRGRIDWSSVREYEFAGAPSRARRVVRTGDVLFGTVRPGLQSHAAIPAGGTDGGIVASTGFSVIRARPGKADPRFLFQFVMSDELKRQAERVAVGSNYPAVNESDVRRFEFPSFAFTEQCLIGEILDSADVAIRTTEQMVAKLERMNQGLLHDLLTRGVEATGASRDPRRNPAQFRQSPLGLLPRDWKVLSVATLVESAQAFIQTGPFGSQLHASDYVSAGVPVVMPQDLVQGQINTAHVARIREEKAQALGRHRMQPGDIVFSRRGDLSKCAAITEAEDGWLCGTGCLLLRPPRSTVRSNWFAALYRHDLCQRQIAAAAVGSTMVNLNSRLLGALQIPLPLTTEQDQICAVIDAGRHRADLLRFELEKLRLAKHGLMRDLLSGPFRAPLAAEAMPASARVSA